MQLAIPPDLRIYNRLIYILMKWYKVTGATGWQKMSDRARTAQHCQVVRRADLHGRAGDIYCTQFQNYKHTQKRQVAP